MTNPFEQTPLVVETEDKKDVGDSSSAAERKERAKELIAVLNDRIQTDREMVEVLREEKISELMQRYPDYRDYELFFVLTKGTMHREAPPAGGCKHFDFPGGEIERFISV